MAAGDTLIRHSELVARKSLELAGNLGLSSASKAFIEEAALLHDIGIRLTNAPDLHCHGENPYIMHGVLGREMLEAEGMTAHALVCERHVGAGLTRKEIRSSGLPLPEREMLPLSIEEKIICVADKFFRKGIVDIEAELSIGEAVAIVERYGPGPAGRFRGWLKELGLI